MTHYNPSISEAPRNQDTPIVRRATEETILAWLERTGRLRPYETNNASSGAYPPVAPTEEHDEII